MRRERVPHLRRSHLHRRPPSASASASPLRGYGTTGKSGGLKTASVTLWNVPAFPGTCPTTYSRFRAGSTLYTSAFFTVLSRFPIRPAIFFPLKTRPGSCEFPMLPCARCFFVVPCDAGKPLKPHRFIGPWNPLPIVRALDVHVLRGDEVRRAELRARGEHRVLGDGELAQHALGGDAVRGEVPERRASELLRLLRTRAKLEREVAGLVRHLLHDLWVAVGGVGEERGRGAVGVQWGGRRGKRRDERTKAAPARADRDLGFLAERARREVVFRDRTRARDGRGGGRPRSRAREEQTARRGRAAGEGRAERRRRGGIRARRRGVRTSQSSTHRTVRGTETPCSFHSRVIPHLTATRPTRRRLRSLPGRGIPSSSKWWSLNSAYSLMRPGFASAAADAPTKRAPRGAPRMGRDEEADAPPPIIHGATLAGAATRTDAGSAASAAEARRSKPPPSKPPPARDIARSIATRGARPSEPARGGVSAIAGLGKERTDRTIIAR